MPRPPTRRELLLRELLSTVRHFSEHLRVIQEIAREIQRKLNTSIGNEHLLRMFAIYSDVLSSLMDARGAIINNNMNVLLRNLTLINVVFLPLGVLAGIGGMSEFTMMTGSARGCRGRPGG